VGLMLLMLKLTLPSLKGLMAGTADSMARSQLIGDLNSARAMALRNGSPVYVVFMPVVSPINYEKEFDDPNLRNFDVMPTEADIKLVSGTGDEDLLKKHRKSQIKLAEKYLLDPKEGNSMLAEQSVSYAIYADYLPGDQPSAPSKRWLTDWKRLPAGFYFAEEDLNSTRDSANASGEEDVLTFNNLKNGHSRGSRDEFGVFVERKMRLPYLMYNSRGEMAARGNAGELRVGDFYLKLTEGGVLPARDANGTYSLTDADREDSSVVRSRKCVWLRINGITGRAGVLEEDPEETELYEMWVHSLSKEPEDVANEVVTWLAGIKEWPSGVATPKSDSAWAQDGLWGSRDELGLTGIIPGNYIFIGNQNPSMEKITRPEQPVVTGIPRAGLMRLIAHLRRFDAKIELRYRQYTN